MGFPFPLRGERPCLRSAAAIGSRFFTSTSQTPGDTRVWAQLSAGGGAQKHQRPEGELVLFEDIQYFFYITNHTDYRAEQIAALANERCEQENVIEQLKNGVNAMRMPVDDLMSNWAYMVMSALAWNLKSWYGLLMPNRQRELVRMEFRRFLHAIVLLPAQIVRSGRKIIYRI